MEKECSPGTPAKDSNIFITIIHEDQRCSFAFDKNRLIINLKEELSWRLSLSFDQLKLIFDGKILKDLETLDMQGLKNGCIAYLVSFSEEPGEAERIPQEMSKLTGLSRLSRSLLQQMLGSHELARSILALPPVLSVLRHRLEAHPRTKKFLQGLSQPHDLVQYAVEAFISVRQLPLHLAAVKADVEESGSIDNGHWVRDASLTARMTHVVASPQAKPEALEKETFLHVNGNAPYITTAESSKLPENQAEPGQVDIAQVISDLVHNPPPSVVRAFLNCLAKRPQLIGVMLESQHLFSHDKLLQKRVAESLAEFLKHEEVMKMVNSTEALQALDASLKSLNQLHNAVPGLFNRLADAFTSPQQHSTMQQVPQPYVRHHSQVYQHPLFHNTPQPVNPYLPCYPSRFPSFGTRSPHGCESGGMLNYIHPRAPVSSSATPSYGRPGNHYFSGAPVVHMRANPHMFPTWNPRYQLPQAMRCLSPASSVDSGISCNNTPTPVHPLQHQEIMRMQALSLHGPPVFKVNTS